MSNEIAMEIASLESDLISGTVKGQEVVEQLRDIKKKALAAPATPLDGYRADAVEQLQRVSEMIGELDLSTVPDMQLFHLSCCCEMAASKVYRFFYLRNDQAAVTPGQGVVNVN